MQDNSNIQPGDPPERNEATAITGDGLGGRAQGYTSAQHVNLTAAAHDLPAHFAGSLRAIHQMLGRSAAGTLPVLVPIPYGEKGPRHDAWQSVALANYLDPSFEVTFSRPDPNDHAKRIVTRRVKYLSLFDRANVGVLQGQPSAGLCSIDVDDDAAVDAFIALNPRLSATLRTQGSRGCNFWLWVTGEYPKLHKDIVWRKADGSPDKSRPFGEWRSTGGQTVISGRHPSGADYTILTEAAPVRIDFSEIRWPDELHLPWLASAVTKPGRTVSGESVKAALELQFGDAYQTSKSGDVSLNQPFWAAAMASRHRILHAPEELRYYLYEAAKGLWGEASEDRIKWMFGEFIMDASKQSGVSALVFKRNNQTLGALAALLRGYAEKRDAFKRQMDEKTGLPRFIVHVKNGMLRLDGESLLLEDFSPEFYSRNQLNVALDENADCPRFLGELLEPAIAAEDVELMQRWAGSLILGVNLPQKMMVLTGTAGGGKTTVINVLSEIIGRSNVGQLRTEHLHERFELFRLIGRTFLYGTDVPGTFMQSDGAYVIKSLVGGDLMDAEPKNGNACFQLKGEFNVGITCNTRLKVRLDGDADAWRRRLLIIPYERPKPKIPDPLFVQRLLQSESSGILNWAVVGARNLLAELQTTGRMSLTSSQEDRIDSLLAESDSIREFARKSIVRAPGEKVTVERLNNAYVDFCEQREWTPESLKRVERILPDVLAELYRATRGNDIPGSDSKPKKGYRGIALTSAPIELAASASTGGADHAFC